MSYCVNCGVKLKNSEKKCPLCNTKVINPNKLNNNYEETYSNKLELFKKINYKYVIKLILIILISISLIILICDYLTSGNISWSIYVVISILYMTCHLQYLFQKNIYLKHIIELISSELFMFIIAYLNNGIHWYLYLILPFIFIVFMYIILCTYILTRKNINTLKKLSICLLGISLSLIGIESAIDLYIRNNIKYNWSIFASVPILVISIIIFIISYNHKLIDEIKQRIFI